jgi:hypothetical protein
MVATNGLTNLITTLLTGTGWALAIFFGAILALLFTILAIFFVALAIEQGALFALRLAAKRHSVPSDAAIEQ